MATVKTFQVKSGLRYSVDWYGLNGVRRRKNFKDKKVAERFAKEIEVKKMRINAGLEVSLESNLPLPNHGLI